jgi:hypothetical protein
MVSRAEREREREREREKGGLQQVKGFFTKGVVKVELPLMVHIFSGVLNPLSVL